jgi:hypothetical protein
MADNDQALGRIVAYLSAQPEWKKIAIFVTQDDSGGDDDSIDRHRSFVLCIVLGLKGLCVARAHLDYECHQVDLHALKTRPQQPV